MSATIGNRNNLQLWAQPHIKQWKAMTWPNIKQCKHKNQRYELGMQIDLNYKMFDKLNLTICPR